MHWLIIWLLSARVTCLKATMSCPQCYPSPCDGPHNVFIKTVPPLLGACIFYQWRELLPLYASCGGCVHVSAQYHEDCHSASSVDYCSPLRKIVRGFSQCWCPRWTCCQIPDSLCCCICQWEKRNCMRWWVELLATNFPPPSVRKFNLVAIHYLLFVSDIQIRHLEPKAD